MLRKLLKLILIPFSKYGTIITEDLIANKMMAIYNKTNPTHSNIFACTENGVKIFFNIDATDITPSSSSINSASNLLFPIPFDYMKYFDKVVLKFIEDEEYDTDNTLTVTNVTHNDINNDELEIVETEVNVNFEIEYGVDFFKTGGVVNFYKKLEDDELSLMYTYEVDEEISGSYSIDFTVEPEFFGFNDTLVLEFTSNLGIVTTLEFLHEE